MQNLQTESKANIVHGVSELKGPLWVAHIYCLLHAELTGPLSSSTCLPAKAAESAQAPGGLGLHWKVQLCTAQNQKTYGGRGASREVSTCTNTGRGDTLWKLAPMTEAA